MPWQFQFKRRKPSLLRPMSLDATSMLRVAEESAEMIYAGVRVIVLASLAVLFFVMDEVHRHNDIAVASLVLYGILTATSLCIAWRRVFRWWMPYAFVTFDIVLIGIHLFDMTKELGLPPTMLFSIPASGLLLVVLTHASLRFRPTLIIYAAGVSVALVSLGATLLPAGRGFRAGAPLGSYAPHTDALLYWLLLPVVIIVLVSIMLWLTSWTTSNLLDQAIAQAKRSSHLSRFFSPNLVDRLSGDRQDDLLAGGRCTVAILFVDIRGFTAMTEKMRPDHVSSMLTQFRSIVTKQIFNHDGTVDKFIGDAVMAVFGTPETRDDDGRRAVLCGLAILKAMRDWEAAKSARGERTISIGIGGHYGEVFAGAIGDEQLLEFTVLGDTVNVAERLEELCGEIGGSFVISEALFRVSGGGLNPAAWQTLQRVRLTGRKQEIVAYTHDGIV